MPYEILAGLAVGLSVMLFWMGRRFAAAPVEVDDQLARYLIDDMGADPRYAIVTNPSRLTFTERVLIPLWRSALNRLGALAPQRNADAIGRRLETAGRPYGLTVLNFLGLKFIAATLFGVVGLLFGSFVLRQAFLVSILFVLGFGVFGFYMPNIWLSGEIRRRQREIMRALPDALDMIVVCTEAGQGLDQAFKRVGTRWHNALTEEFLRILTEIALGRTRREALTGASDRIQLPDVSNMITAVIQAEQLGVSIGSVLRIQANQMRIVRRQRAEELARQASIKLLFPLVFLIFPAMFAVLLGPAIPLLMQTFSGTLSR